MKKGKDSPWAEFPLLGLPSLLCFRPKSAPLRRQMDPWCQSLSRSRGVTAIAMWATHVRLFFRPRSGLTGGWACVASLPVCHPLHARIRDLLSLPYGPPVSDSSLPRCARLLQQLRPSSPEIPLDRLFSVPIWPIRWCLRAIKTEALRPPFPTWTIIVSSGAIQCCHYRPAAALQGLLTRCRGPRGGSSLIRLDPRIMLGWFRGSGTSAAGRISNPKANAAVGSCHTVDNPLFASAIGKYSTYHVRDVLHVALRVSDQSITCPGVDWAAPVMSSVVVHSAPPRPCCADSGRRTGGRSILGERSRLEELRIGAWVIDLRSNLGL
jgi:hypothetical protein